LAEAAPGGDARSGPEDPAATGSDRAATEGTESALNRLMVNYQHGDRTSAEELIRLVSPMLYRYLTWPAINRMDGEDLLQECWLRVHKARHTFRPPAPVLPWIFAIARHTKIDAHRRRIRVKSREFEVEVLPETANPPPRHKAEEGLLDLLAELPESQREVLLLMKVSGMSLSEVARVTSSTVGAVKQKAHRGYSRLRKLLEERS